MLYIINDGDQVIEQPGEGTDRVDAMISYTLTSNVENLTLIGSAAISGTGNTLNNTITGNNANNFLRGSGGNDRLVGNGGNDTLDGGTGADAMVGGTGNDVFIVDSGSDSVTESAGQGLDTVNSSVSYTLSNNVERLTLTGTTAFSGTGNTLNNTITGNNANNLLRGLGGNDRLVGNGGNDTLDGGTGADTMFGGTGNDVFVVDSGSDSVIESAGQGLDTVNSSISYILASNVENLILTGAGATSGAGNTLNNTITGNNASNTLTGSNGNDRLVGNGGNDTLDGGTGADTMVGGTGNDVFVVDSASDSVIESAGQGIDTVNAGVSYTLANNVENLTLAGIATPSSGTGNTLNNTITGNAANNTLQGNGGNDRLVGNGGNDTLDGGTGGDILFGDGGNDSLFGGSGNDQLQGGSGDDILQGAAASDADQGSQIDVLSGGVGSDTFVLRSTAEPGMPYSGDGYAIIGDFEAGVDRVQLSNDYQNYSLGSVNLTGDEAIADTGIFYQGDLVAVLQDTSNFLLERDGIFIGPDGTAAGVLEFDAEDYSVNEAAGTITVTINRFGGSEGAISVTVAAQDGSAVSPADYQLTDPVVTFADGETQKTVQIQINDDLQDELDEQFGLTLQAPTDGAVLGNQVTTTVTILDDDVSAAPPTVTVALVDDTGSSNSDRITTDGTVSGTITTTSTITRLEARLDTTEPSPFVDILSTLQPDGSFTIDQTQLIVLNGGALVDGTYTLVLQAEDAIGQVSDSIALTFTLDTTAPTLSLVTPVEGGSHSPTARLIGDVSDNGGPVTVDSTLNNTPSTSVTVDADGRLDQRLDSSLANGEYDVTVTAVDVAGNQTDVVTTFQVSDDVVVQPSASEGWGVQQVDGVVLGEQNSFVTQAVIPVQLGRADGSRLVRFELDALFDETDTTALVDDQLLVYLTDSPSSTNLTLLDAGQAGTALFSLAGSHVEFVPGLVRYDGTAVEIDLTSLTDDPDNTGYLVFQLLNQDADIGSIIQVSNLANTVDISGSASPVFPMPSNVVDAGAALDLTGLNTTTDVDVQIGKVRFDAPTGQMTATVSVRNGETAVGRQVAVVFDTLPAGVQLLNPSGIDGNGNPYINLAPAIRPGGLAANAVSDAIEIVFDNPNGIRMPLTAQVLVGEPNQAPSFPALGALSMMPGEQLNIPLQATDPDGDAVSIRLESDGALPNGGVINNDTLTFSPTPDQLGSYTFTLIATDGVLETQQTVTLDVVADPITTTRVSGVIQNIDEQPLAGVPIELGAVQTTTDANGRFTLEVPTVAPEDALIVRGEQLGGSIVYPYIAERLSLVLSQGIFDGVNNVIERPIYLPPIDVANGQVIDPAVDTDVSVVLIPNTAAANVSVAAGTLKDQQGNPFTGTLSITQVPNELTPAALPPNLSPDLVVTIQPGEMVFETPAPLTLPNLAGYEPGIVTDLWSINPITGDFDKVGVGQVSADGTVIETTEGGIINSSWYFFAPPPNVDVRDPGDNPLNINVNCNNCFVTDDFTSEVELHSGAVIETHDLVSYQSLGQPMGFSLTYDSLRADPRPIVHLDGGVFAPSQSWQLVAELTVKRDGFEYQVPGFEGGQAGFDGGEHFWSLPEGASSFDIALQADLKSQASGRYDYEFTSGIFRSGRGSSSTSTGQLIHVNTIDSAFGSGWGLAGLQELVENPDGSVLLIDGDGSELLFEAPTTPGGAYVAPPGDFSVLEQLADGTFRRTLKDQTVYEFNANNQLVVMRDRNSNTFQYLYDAQGRFNQLIDPVGQVTTLSYTGDRITAIEDPASRITQLEYDTTGNLIKITDPDGTFRTFEYDADRHMTAEIDKRGNREEAFYDFAGRATHAVRKDGSVVRVNPAQVQGLYRPEVTSNRATAPMIGERIDANVSVADGSGKVTQRTLDQAGQHVSAVDGEGVHNAIQRDAQTINLVEALTDPRGNATSFDYDDRGNLIRVTDTVPDFDPVVTGDLSFVDPSIDKVLPDPLNAFISSDANRAVAVGDLTNNSFPDLVTPDGQVFINDGTGAFSLNGSVDTASTEFGTFADVAVADLDADGNLDLVSLGSLRETSSSDVRHVVTVRLGNGDGTFQEGSEYAVIRFPEKLFVKDLNNDGILDIVAEGWNGFPPDVDDLSVLLGNGDGTFNAQPSVDFRPADGSLPLLAIETFDGDDTLDLLLRDSVANDRRIVVVPGNGDGTFAFGQEIISSTVGDRIQTSTFSPPFAFGDVNHDNALDIISGGGYGSENVMVRLGEVDAVGRATGTFAEATIFSLGTTTDSTPAVSLADLDNDGNLDILVEAEYDPASNGDPGPITNVSVLKGGGAGSFTLVTGLNPTFLGGEITPGDFDQNGTLDVLFVDDGFDGVSASLNGPTTTPQEVVRQFTYDETYNQLTSMTDELGRQILYEIDPTNGNLLSRRQVVGQLDTQSSETDDLVSSYTYNARGQMDVMTDARGRITDYDYNSNGLLTRITFAKGTADEAVREFLEYDLAGNLTRFRDENGTITEFRYDLTNNRLIEVVEADPDGAGPLASPVTGYQYDEEGNLTTITDARNHVTSYTFDEMNQVSSMTEADPDGGGPLAAPLTQYEYDDAGNRIKMIDPLGHETQYRYDSRNRRTAMIDPEGGITRYRYDADNNLVGVVDPNQNLTTYVYDSRDRLIRMIDPSGISTRYEYDAVNNRTAMIDRNGHRTEYVYDEINRLVERVNARQDSAFFGYDKVGNLTSQTDELNRTTSFAYDNRNRQTQVTDALNGVTAFTYDDVGNLLSVSDELTRTTTYGYDDLYRLTSITDPLMHTTTYGYDAVDNRTSMTDARNFTTTYDYDALNRLTTMTNPLLDTVTYDYDADDNLTAVTDELGRTTRFGYDRRDWQTSVTDPLGHTTQTEYDANGNISAIVDALGNRTSYEYDKLDRLTKEIDALTQTTVMTYDAKGNLTSVTDPANNVTTYEYDELDRLTNDTNQLGFSRSYDYDAVGNLTRSTDRNNRQIDYTYDALNRLDLEEWLDGTQSVIHTVDYDYNAADQFTRVSDAYATYAYDYDGAGRLIQVDNTGTPGVPSVQLDYGYDDANNLTSVSDTINGVAAGVEAFTYDALNRVSQITQSGNGVVDKRVDLGYDAASQMTSIERFSDLAGTQTVADTAYAYDLAGRLTAIDHTNANGSIANYGFTYDAVNRLTQLTTPDGTSDYSYDARYQLTDATYDYQSDEVYTYDENGNRTNAGYDTEENNRLLTDGTYTYTYDNEGNRTTRTEIATGEVPDIVCDHRNRLIQVITKDSGGTVTHAVDYTYDAFDRRLSKTIDADGAGSGAATAERFVYDGEHIALVFDELGTLSQRYLHGPEIDQVLAQDEVQTGEVLWALGDHQGSVRDVVDNSGTLVNHITYESFGQITGESDPIVDFRFGFTGRETDEETDPNFYRARYYDPAVGQFISEDPIGFAAGDVNLYRYVGNSPTNFTDPSGKDLYDVLNRADQFAAGFGDAVTFGGTTRFRNWSYGESVSRNHQGPFFRGGQFTGIGASIGLGFGAPLRLAGPGITTAQRIAQGHTIIGAGVASYQSTRNIIEGCATPLDALSFAPLAGPVFRGLSRGRSATGALSGGISRSNRSVAGGLSDGVSRTGNAGDDLARGASSLDDVLPTSGSSNIGGPFDNLPKRGPFNRSEINVQGLEDAANRDIGSGLTEVGRALTKHANDQRMTSPFPRLSGNNQQISQTASQQLNEILNSSDASFTRLGRGGIQVDLPDGRGVRFNADGSLSGFID